jgi:hypothetical protein
LIKVSKIVDNPWIVAMVRAEKTGTTLADALIYRVQGERGVNLVGFGLGSRVIYSCLMTLSEKRVFGLIDNVVIIGGPCPAEIRVWTSMKSVITGRLTNVYSENDYLLGFLSRTGSWTYGIAGLQRIRGVPGVENVDMSGHVHCHHHWRYLVGSILKKIGFEDVSHSRVANDQEIYQKILIEDQERDAARKWSLGRPGPVRVTVHKTPESATPKKENQPLGKRGGISISK